MSDGQQPPHTPSNQPTPPPPVPPQAAPSYGVQPTYGSPQGYGGSNQPYGAPYSGQQPYPQQPDQDPYGYGAPGAPMARPGTVTAGSVLAFIGGGFMVIFGLFLTVIAGSGVADDLDIPGYGADAGGVMIGLGLVCLLFGALIVLFGVFAMRGKRWAAIALAVLAGLALVGMIINLASGDGSGLVGVVWGAVSVGLLLAPSSRAWYSSRG